MSETLVAWVSRMFPLCALILVGAAAADRLLNRWVSPGTRLVLYGAVFLRVLIPGGWQSPIGIFGGAPALAPLPEARWVEPAVLAETTTMLPAVMDTPDAVGDSWLAILYLVVLGVLALRWARSRWALARELRSARPFAMTDDVRVFVHPSAGPLVAGVLRPRVILPEPLAHDVERRAWVLRHEVAHVRRRDPLLDTLLQLTCIAAWPILPLWLAARRMRTLMEQACDERALAGADGAMRRRYGEILLAVASPRAVSGALTFGSPLKQRLQALAPRRHWRRGVQAMAVVTLGAAMIACGAPAEEEVDALVDDAGSDAIPAFSSSALSEGNQRPVALSHGARQEGASGRARTSVVASPSESREVETASTGGASAKAAAKTEPRSFVPRLDIRKDGSLWLQTRRGGVGRVDTWRPLEGHLADAHAETGSRTLAIWVDTDVPQRKTDEVVARAKSAGFTDFAVALHPVARAGARPMVHLATRVTVTRNGTVLLWDHIVEWKDLETELRRELERSRYSERSLRSSARLNGEFFKGILILADPGAPRMSTRWVIDIAGRAGFKAFKLSNDRAPVLPITAAADARVEGELNIDDIRRVARERLDEVKHCYDTGLALNPRLAGRAVVRMTVAEDGGVVTSTLAESSLGDARVENCLVTMVRRWAFPRPTNRVAHVELPFNFSTGPTR